jgi:hypothetical protein
MVPVRIDGAMVYDLTGYPALVAPHLAVNGAALSLVPANST